MKLVSRSKLLVLSLALAAAAWTGIAQADAPLVSTTGTVISRDGDVLVVRTDKGNLTFDLDKSTEMPTDIPVNSRITVWYDSDDKPEDRMDARRVVIEPAVAQQTTPPPTTTTPPPTQTDISTSQTQVETQTQTTDYDTSDDELPSTAGPLPLLAGLGILSLLGSVVLKNRSRRS
jgi:hypothetical protein